MTGLEVKIKQLIGSYDAESTEDIGQALVDNSSNKSHDTEEGDPNSR